MLCTSTQSLTKYRSSMQARPQSPQSHQPGVCLAVQKQSPLVPVTTFALETQHQTGLAELDSPIMDKAHYITGFKFGYSYVSGYGRDPSTSGRGANFSLILGSCRDLSSAATLLYASPELVDYPYDKCRAWPSCYSPEVSAEVKDLKVATSQPLRLALKFQNNDRNLQIHLPLNVSLSWSNGAVTKISVGHRVKPHDYPVEAVEPWGNNDDGVIGDRTIFL